MTERFAEALAAARRQGGVVDEVPPLDLAAGYAVADRLWSGLGTPAGWKIGATSAGAQAFLGIAAPIRGRVFDTGLHSPGDIAIPGDRAAEAEPEILFRLARPVARGEDPVAAVDRVALGLEIVRPSRDDAFALGAGFIVADNAAHMGVVIGPEIDPALLDDPAAITLRLLLNGTETARGDASAVLGDPRIALRWLATQTPLDAGEWVASGAILRAARLAIGDKVTADFGALGEVSVRRVSRADPAKL